MKHKVINPIPYLQARDYMELWNKQNPENAFKDDELKKFIVMYESDLICTIKEPKKATNGLDIMKNARRTI